MKAAARLGRFVLCALVLALGSAAFAPAPVAAADLNVFAAASLSDALEEIAAAYEKQGGDHLVLNLAASSTLARQIQEGAPADLFLSADEEKMDSLERQKLLVPGTRKSVLSNTLVIVVPNDSRLKITGAADLAALSIRAIALAEPQSVPAGIYAKEYLKRQKVWSAVIDRVVSTENVRAALAAVESGNVDAGIVYKTDAEISKRVKVAYRVPEADSPKISYPFAVVAGSKQKESAQKLLAYLQSPPALEVFKKFGFLLLGGG